MSKYIYIYIIYNIIAFRQCISLICVPMQHYAGTDRLILRDDVGQ